MKPQLVMTLHVEVGEPLHVGRVLGGELTLIPITGGTFAGPELHGQVLPGGADWNTRLSAQESHVCARYWIQTDDGSVICIHNEGILRQGNDPEDFLTTPSFQCDLDGPCAALMEGQYAGTLRGAGEHAVKVGVFRIS
jgi:hypothetical protein